MVCVWGDCPSSCLTQSNWDPEIISPLKGRLELPKEPGSQLLGKPSAGLCCQETIDPMYPRNQRQHIHRARGQICFRFPMDPRASPIQFTNPLLSIMHPVNEQLFGLSVPIRRGTLGGRGRACTGLGLYTTVYYRQARVECLLTSVSS